MKPCIPAGFTQCIVGEALPTRRTEYEDTFLNSTPDSPTGVGVCFNHIILYRVLFRRGGVAKIMSIQPVSNKQVNHILTLVRLSPMTFKGGGGGHKISREASCPLRPRPPPPPLETLVHMFHI